MTAPSLLGRTDRTARGGYGEGDENSRPAATAVTVTDQTGLDTLLERTAAGDRTAFAELYDRTSARVYGMVLRVLRDPGYSEETVQEVYLQVWRRAETYRPDLGSPIAWLLSIAHRRAVDRVRSETSATRRESDYGARELVTLGDQVSEEVVARDDGRRVRDCLGGLTDAQSEAVSLAYFGGLTYREVAERLSVGLPAVKSRIRDGLKRLRGCLESE